MGMIQREIDTIRLALLRGEGPKSELYAAQQALEWALEPGGIRSPASMLLGTQEGLGDCSARRRLQPSLDIHSQIGSQPPLPKQRRFGAPRPRRPISPN